MQITPSSQHEGLEVNLFNRQRLYNYSQAINGGIDAGISSQTATQYTGNLNGQWVQVTAPPTPNTEFPVVHSLGRIPSWYIYNTDRAAIVYQLPNTGTPWTQTTVFLKCDTASASLRIFLS